MRPVRPCPTDYAKRTKNAAGGVSQAQKMLQFSACKQRQPEKRTPSERRADFDEV